MHHKIDWKGPIPVLKDIPLEIERKFLIKMPDLSSLQAASNAVWQIEQMYLQCFEKGEVRRIRRVTCAGKVQYFYTEKRHVSELSCEEREQKITAPEYEALQVQRCPGSQVIRKTRYRIAWDAHILEIDVYPFWQDRAILEVELGREDELFTLPAELQVYREVTGDIRYKNATLAFQIVTEPLDQLTKS